MLTREEKANRWADLVGEWVEQKYLDDRAWNPRARRTGTNQDGAGFWRTQYRQPLLPNADYTAVENYDSPSGAGDLIEDGRGLRLHECRTGAMVVAHDEDIRDLILSTLPARLDEMTKSDKQRLDSIVKDGKGAVGAFGAANRGTTIHAYLERMNRGEPLGKVPEKYKEMLASAQAALPDRYDIFDAERFVACSEMRFAGTLDARGRRKWTSGKAQIIDNKSGKSTLEYPKKMALQLAIYAHSQPVDPFTGELLSWDIPTDFDEALLLHIPSDGVTAELYPVDIRTAWEMAAPAARYARDWQSLRGERLLGEPLKVIEDSPFTQNYIDPVLTEIDAATSEDELVEVWNRNKARWTQPHTQAAQERKRALAANAAAA